MPKQHDKQFKLDADQYFLLTKSLVFGDLLKL